MKKVRSVFLSSVNVDASIVKKRIPTRTMREKPSDIHSQRFSLFFMIPAHREQW